MATDMKLTKGPPAAQATPPVAPLRAAQVRPARLMAAQATGQTVGQARPVKRPASEATVPK